MEIILPEHSILGDTLHLVPDTTDCGELHKIRNTGFDNAACFCFSIESIGVSM